MHVLACDNMCCLLLNIYEYGYFQAFATESYDKFTYIWQLCVLQYICVCM